MRIHLLRRQRWFLVTNALMVERSHAPIARASLDHYLSRGIVTMCAHCRCCRRNAMPATWDFVPDYLCLKGRALVAVSHGLCPLCEAYFYPTRSQNDQDIDD